MKNLLITLAVLSLLGGCASVKTNSSMPYKSVANNKIYVDVINSGSEISEQELNFITQKVRGGLNGNGKLAARRSQGNHIAEVKIVSFRMREDAARLTVGIMAGCDHVKSSVSVKDARTGKELGLSDINIKECAAWGTANQVMDKYSDGVVRFLTSK